MPSLKQSIRRLPVLGPLAAELYWRVRRRAPFPGSAKYWDQRYAAGGTSGAGSYNRLAAFKAEVLNGFVAEHGITRVLEFGCGDGAQLSLATYENYVGVDVAPSAVALCRARFGDGPTKCFYVAGELPAEIDAELTLSLDVIYHLVEDEVYERYLQELFARSRRFVCLYSSNEDRIAREKHVRHRHIEAWIGRNAPGWTLLRHVPNRYPHDPADPGNTSFADFFFYERSVPPEGGHALHL
ncbi:MAG: class I SAM-dependent methyltransferase [Acetobacteraceae bacterium]|nr:class I SAM-dependent methyltransferase [Acetobacteraceae bacterium]